MNYNIDHIPRNTPLNRRPGIAMMPQYLTVHSTGNPNSTAKNERAWLTNPQNKVTASWHIVIDEKEAIEAVPLGEVAWHAGDGNGQGNRASIGIEICESGNRQKTLQKAVELVAKMLKERGWGVDRLRRHYDWSKKICPRIMADSNWASWEQFKKDVQKQLGGQVVGATKVKVRIKGKDYLLDGFIMGGTNYVPIRSVAEALGFNVGWDDTTQTVVIR